MTRCMTLITIAVIASTAFLTTFAQDINVVLRDSEGTVHKFDGLVRDECKKFTAVIDAVRLDTDANSCTVYESDDCSSKTQEDWVGFDSYGFIVDGADGFKAMSVYCEE